MINDNKKKEEKVTDVNFTNLAIEHIIHYTNILDVQNKFLKDNDMINFSSIDSFHEIQEINLFYH